MAGRNNRGLVVVTGASTGIGLATARVLASAGYRVLAGVRREADAQAIAQDGIEGVILDVTQPDHIAAVRERVEHEGGLLTALVNNAGIFISGAVEASPMSRWREQFDVNVFGLVETTQALLPAVRRARGTIVNISSVGGKVTMPLMGAYQGSKYAVESISDALRMEVAGQGVRVVIVEPGAIRTEILSKSQSQGEAALATLSPEHRQLYGSLMQKLLEVVPKFEAQAIPAEKAGRVVLKAIESARPRTRYVVGADAHLMLTLKYWLPDRWFDSAIQRLLQVHQLPKKSVQHSPQGQLA